MERSVRLLVVFGVALGLAGTARADLYPSSGLDPDAGGGAGTSYVFHVMQVGDAVVEGSWAAPVGAFSTAGPIDMIAVQISGDAFSDTAFSNFSVGGWSETMSNGALAAASGPGAGSVLFNLHFSGDLASPLEFDLAAFSGDTLIGSMHGTWDGVGPFIYFSAGDWSPTRSSLVTAVPAPGAVAPAVLGLGLIGVIRRRLA
jgi:hypothetical protein